MLLSFVSSVVYLGFFYWMNLKDVNKGVFLNILEIKFVYVYVAPVHRLGPHLLVNIPICVSAAPLWLRLASVLGVKAPGLQPFQALLRAGCSVDTVAWDTSG